MNTGIFISMKIGEIYNSLFEIKYGLDTISDLILLTLSTNDNKGGVFYYITQKLKSQLVT